MVGSGRAENATNAEAAHAVIRRGNVAQVGRLGEFMSLLDDFKTAAETQGQDENGKYLYIDAILAFIGENAEELLVGDTAGLFNSLPAGGGRQQAIAIGLREIKNLFGDFADPSVLITALGRQVEVEYHKAQLINSIDGAREPENLEQEAALVKAAIGTYLGQVNGDRQDLIDEWNDATQPLAVQARAAELEAQLFTVSLKALHARMDDADADNFLNLLSAKFVDTRKGTHYYGDGTLIPALDAAADAVDAQYAFNSAISTADVIAAIKLHGESLLDAGTLAHFQAIPDPSGRLNAVADGILEIRKFFGPFASEATVETAVELHIETEYNKLMFIRAVDSADAGSMDEAIRDWVDDLNQQRQDLIADWKSKAAPGSALADRVAELESETYTLILKEVKDRLDEEGFLEALAAKLLEARNALPGDDKHFYSVVKIVEAMDAAVDELDIPEAPATQSVTTDEDTVITHDIGATDRNGDPLTYSVKNGAGPQKGTVTFADGKFTYTPASDVSGTDTFTIVISDGESSIEQTVTVTINAVNDAPADIILSNGKVAENAIDGTPVGQLTATDPEGGVMKFALLDDAGGRFKLETKDGVTSLVVANGLKLDYEQAKFHTVRVQVTDSDNKTYEETLTIDLTDVANETVTGTSGTDVLVGGTGKDVFNGGLGDDKISGGLGNDVLTGGKGKDVFVFDSKLGTSTTDRKVNFDTIKDFSVKDDSLYLDNAIFKKLGSGTEAKPKQLSKSFFTIGDKAKDKNDYIIYNDKTGVLSYDADGSGKGKAVEFAQLSKKLTTLSHKDFFVI